jgi:hypothetical protein
VAVEVKLVARMARAQRTAAPALLREHGRHLPDPQRNAAPIEWQRVAGPLDPARLKDMTCTCRPVVHEYVSAGGLYFVRRFDYGASPVTVEETARLPEREASALWTRLLTGQAR